MITADGRGFVPDDDEGEETAPEIGYTPPTPRPPAPPRGPVWAGPNSQDRDYFDRTDYTAEPVEDETDRERILREDKSARLERMIWRNAFLGIYALALIMYAFWALQRDSVVWNLSAFVVLLVGAGGVGLFLVSRESGEREIEFSRSKPESRHSVELPGLRRPAGMGGYPDDVLDGR